MNNPARLIPILRYALLALGLIAGPAVALAQTAPTVTTHPSSATVTLPTAATAAFSVVVSGDPAPGLQWQVNAGPGWVTLFNDANYSGVTTASLSVAGVTTAMNGYQYRAVATNASGTVNSNPAPLTVQSVPAFTV